MVDSVLLGDLLSGEVDPDSSLEVSDDGGDGKKRPRSTSPSSVESSPEANRVKGKKEKLALSPIEKVYRYGVR